MGISGGIKRPVRGPLVKATTCGGLPWDGEHGGSTFLPTKLANLSLWLRSDMGITTDTGGVSAWADQSGAENDAAQATSGVRPDFTTSDANFNGHPSVNFTASADDFLTVTHAANLQLSGAGYSIYWAVNVAVGTTHILGVKGTEWIIQSSNSGNGGNLAAFVRNAADTAFISVTGDNLDTGTTVVFRFQWKADDVTLGTRIDAATEDTGTGVGHHLDTGDVVIGDAADAADFDCAEIIIVQREVSATEDTAIMGYLNARYGL